MRDWYMSCFRWKRRFKQMVFAGAAIAMGLARAAYADCPASVPDESMCRFNVGPVTCSGFSYLVDDDRRCHTAKWCTSACPEMCWWQFGRASTVCQGRPVGHYHSGAFALAAITQLDQCLEMSAKNDPGIASWLCTGLLTSGSWELGCAIVSATCARYTKPEDLPKKTYCTGFYAQWCTGGQSLVSATFF